MPEKDPAHHEFGGTISQEAYNQIQELKKQQEQMQESAIEEAPSNLSLRDRATTAKHMERKKRQEEEASRAMLDEQERGKVAPKSPTGSLTPNALPAASPTDSDIERLKKEWDSNDTKPEVTPAPAPTPVPKSEAEPSSSGTIPQDNLPQKGPTVERANQAAPQKQSSVETPSQGPPKEASSAAFNRAMSSAALGDKHFKTTAVA